MILDPLRPKYEGGENWLGHGARAGLEGGAYVDELLLDGATWEQLKERRKTRESFDSHCDHLKSDHDLLVEKVDGEWRFDRAHLNITDDPSLEEISESHDYVEGATYTFEANACERNAEARLRCIEHWGLNCCICGFNFEAAYGSLARGLIHVHHLEPLSENRTEHKVDPVADLRPICPNCHAVIDWGGHLRTIKEMRDLPPHGVFQALKTYWASAVDRGGGAVIGD